VRSFLYWLGRLLGDANAVRKGTIGRRLGRHVTGRWLGKLLRRLFGWLPRALCEPPSVGPKPATVT